MLRGKKTNATGIDYQYPVDTSIPYGVVLCNK